MPQIPGYEQQTDVAVGQNVPQMQPDLTVAKGLDDASQATALLSRKIDLEKTRDNEAWTGNVLPSVMQNAQQAIDGIQPSPNGSDYVAKVKQTLAPLFGSVIDQVQDPEPRNFIAGQLKLATDRFVTKAVSDQQKINQDWRFAQTKSGADKAGLIVQRDPTQFPIQMHILDDTSNNLGPDKPKAMAYARDTLVAAAANSAIQSDPNGTAVAIKAYLDPNNPDGQKNAPAWVTAATPKELDAFQQKAEQVAYQHAMGRDMQSMLAKQQQENASNEAAHGYIQQMTQPNPPADLATRIGSDTHLTWETQRSLIDMAHANIKGQLDKDQQTYGSGFYHLYQAVHAGPGDPNRITDPSQLYSHVGPNGDLTVSGVDRLTREIQAKQTPEGEAETAMKQQFLGNARAQITGTNEAQGLKDTKGDEQYLKFQAQFFPAYDTARAKGVPAADLLNPDSPHYLGKSISTFKRTPAQINADMLASMTGEQGMGVKPAIDLTTPAGIKSAYSAGLISREAAIGELAKHGYVSSKPSVPVEQ